MSVESRAPPTTDQDLDGEPTEEVAAAATTTTPTKKATDEGATGGGVSNSGEGDTFINNNHNSNNSNNNRERPRTPVKMYIGDNSADVIDIGMGPLPPRGGGPSTIALNGGGAGGGAGGTHGGASNSNQANNNSSSHNFKSIESDDEDFSGGIGGASGGHTYGNYWGAIRSASRAVSPSLMDNMSENSSQPNIPAPLSRSKSRPELTAGGVGGPGGGASSRYGNLSFWKARRILFYKNGDPFFPGVEFRFKPGRDISSLEALLDKISPKMDLPRGARYVFSMDGDRKYNLDELEDGASYVVSSFKIFKVSFVLYLHESTNFKKER